MINIIGLGYIGLPTALMFAANGIETTGTDYNRILVNKLNSGEVNFDENGLVELFYSAIAEGIKFTTEYISAETYIIAVPTPYEKASKKIDASYVIKALENIMTVCPKEAIIVIESTIAPRTIDKYIRPIIENNGFVIGKDIHLVHAPERIIPGNMVHELKFNSRTIGCDDKSIGEKIKILYSAFCKGEIIVTDIRTAEMTKVVENTYRDINIAFANELAKICRSDDMDVHEIIKIANMHPRVNILNPGPGVGGHCISVDPWFLVGDYPGLANIILAARKINDSMPEFVLERVQTIMTENKMKDITRVGLYGLTYKENVDDVRESPSLQLIESMSSHLAPILKSYDPHVKRDIVANQYHNFTDFLNDIDFIIIMVAHDEILKNIDVLKNKIVLDTRNICDYCNFYKL